MKRVVWWCIGILVLVTVGGATFATQRREDVLVREPGHRRYSAPVPTATKAVEEHEYAALSANVYAGRWEASLPDSADQASFDVACGDTNRAHRLPVTGWRRWEGFPSSRLVAEARKVDLYFEVWESDESASPRRVVVVFRGTDSWKDWFSNLRWVLRFIPFFEDQYHFVSRGLGEEFNQRFLSNRSHDERVVVIATGHSLGGGLAQHFAYSLPADPRVPRVSRVFAFDPSPVTGWTSVSRQVREANAHGLRTDRIFEHGEILAYVRLLLSYIYPPPAVNPSVTEVRYNFVQSINPLASHSMRQLACDLTRAARSGTEDGFLEKKAENTAFWRKWKHFPRLVCLVSRPW